MKEIRKAILEDSFESRHEEFKARYHSAKEL
jgi:queuine/archaeosine tRNA-ribosyltransferase